MAAASRSHGKFTAGLSVRQRQYKHVLENLLDRGYSYKNAQKIAASVVNRTRARFSRNRRGPKLVGRGGSRNQWWPGKKTKREKFVCLEHKKRFRTKAAMLSHYRYHRKRRRK